MSDEIIIPELDEQQNGNKPQILDKSIPNNLYILGVEQRPIFPGLVLPITFEEKKDIDTIQQAIENDAGYIGLTLIKGIVEGEDIEENELYEIGTAFQIMRIIPSSGESIQVLGQGINRFKKKKTK